MQSPEVASHGIKATRICFQSLFHAAAAPRLAKLCLGQDGISKPRHLPSRALSVLTGCCLLLLLLLAA